MTLFQGTFRNVCVSLGTVAALCLFSPTSEVRAENEDTAPATAGAEESKAKSFSTGTAFFDEAKLFGGVYYFQRDRKRWSPDTDTFKRNLQHATMQANVEFNSGFVGDVIGFDFGVFGSSDLMNHGAVDHEMSFVPWSDPWHPNWSKTHTEDGTSIYKAHLKAKLGNFWGKAGYFQPTGPGVLGVNWSIMPGTYQGAEAGADFGRLSVAVAWADAYKSPWYTSTNNFLQTDGETHVAWMWSSGLRYTFENGLKLEVAYGESEDYLKNAHFKSGYTVEFSKNNSLDLGYHLYLMNDSDNSDTGPNDMFSCLASQHYAYAHYNLNDWTFKLEGTLTRAPFESENQRGYFAYRLTNPNGSSKGAYEPWWDARSDWNADNEKAVFGYVQRRLDDLLPTAGFSAGVGASYGFDGRGYGASEHLKEWGVLFDVGYEKPDGALKGAFVKAHYLIYRNGSHKPDWEPYKNAFQDEYDFKFFMGIPFSI